MLVARHGKKPRKAGELHPCYGISVKTWETDRWDASTLLRENPLTFIDKATYTCTTLSLVNTRPLRSILLLLSSFIYRYVSLRYSERRVT